ncbi:hypothetical protein NEMBOFW57_006918 [Staphylotrichum longicolle]|uniref:Uncharacterized protein n=1 Tax=Staphylotrichum longicolle TaxID=669026 RepID=A0AAD4EXE0_9PEZI|nr:hypothetical protein NEMBOFW57_006918 [Staphylotrichum longicolle]
MSEETSHTISRSASNHTSPAPPTPAGNTSPSSPPSPGADLDENTNQRSLPPLRPSSSASPPPDRPELHPIALTPAPDTTLHLTLGPCTRAFLITSDILGNFTAWGTDATTTTTTNIASSFWPKDDDTDTHTLHINLTSLLPALLLTSSTATASESLTAPNEENELQSHLDALQALLRAMHIAPTPNKEQDGTETIISIAHLWRLSRLHAAGGLGLRRGWIGWLRRACMGGFVARLAGVRGRVVVEAFGIAQKSLCDWTMRIGRRPCGNMTCNANRIAALIVFLLTSGLYPRGRFSRSLHKVVTGLQYITSTDAELMAISIETGEPFGAVDEKLTWAARIRDMYGGACTKCNEKAATSMLFPLEDLLCDLTFEMDDRLLESVEFLVV